MPKPIFEKDLKLGFMMLNKMLNEQKYKQYKFNGSKILEEDFNVENKKLDNLEQLVYNFFTLKVFC